MFFFSIVQCRAAEEETINYRLMVMVELGFLKDAYCATYLHHCVTGN